MLIDLILYPQLLYCLSSVCCYFRLALLACLPMYNVHEGARTPRGQYVEECSKLVWADCNVRRGTPECRRVFCACVQGDRRVQHRQLNHSVATGLVALRNVHAKPCCSIEMVCIVQVTGCVKRCMERDERGKATAVLNDRIVHDTHTRNKQEGLSLQTKCYWSPKSARSFLDNALHIVVLWLQDLHLQVTRVNASIQAGTLCSSCIPKRFNRQQGTMECLPCQ